MDVNLNGVAKDVLGRHLTVADHIELVDVNRLALRADLENPRAGVVVLGLAWPNTVRR